MASQQLIMVVTSKWLEMNREYDERKCNYSCPRDYHSMGIKITRRGGRRPLGFGVALAGAVLLAILALTAISGPNAASAGATGTALTGRAFPAQTATAAENATLDARNTATLTALL